MGRTFSKTGLLVLLAALLVSSLPVFTAQGQTRRKPTVRRSSAATTVVPVGTRLAVRLNDRLSSKDSRVGDRFTATVLEPERYQGATVYGHVSSIRKSGRIKGRTTMTLAFDSITLPNERRGTMRGEVLRVFEPGEGSSAKVDEEGRVESGSRGKQTLKRGGIGAAAGAVLGGLLGGGKGAAIGLIVGGAAGAGSIAIEGSKELELDRGTEMLIRVTRR
ncbi:MAG TPA: hypothetical protein VNO70_01935 [Blastocatellia bacterium]|nr:hypothetical protein [Blastocatellia bacterium]